MKDDSNKDEQSVDDLMDVLSLVQGEIDGQKFWAYVLVPPLKYEEFLRVQQSGEPYSLAEYGEIIRYKVGEEAPPQEVMNEIETQYPGSDHGFEEKLQEEVKRLT